MFATLNFFAAQVRDTLGISGYMQESGKLIVHLDSSLISGISALLFDILLLALIRIQCQVVCSIANLYFIYDKRTPVALQCSRAGFLTEGPVGHPSLSRIFSILLLVVTALAIAIGFSLNGKTIPRYSETSFASKVEFGFVPLDIDFAKEYSEQNGTTMVSKRVLAVFESSACSSMNFTHITLFPHVFSKTMLNRDLIPIRTHLPDRGCVTIPRFRRSNGFSSPMWTGSPDKQCRLTNVTVLGLNADGMRKANFTGDDCHLQVDELFCFRRSCAGIGYSDKERQRYAVLVSDYAVNSKEQVVKLNEEWKISNYTQFVQNVAFFSGAGFSGGMLKFRFSAMARIDLNVRLGTLTERVNVTEVDLGIAGPAVVIIVMSVIGLFAAWGFLWFRVVHLKGRYTYNRFSNVQEILALIDGTRARKTRGGFGDVGSFCIGIRKDLPKIGIDQEAAVSGSDWQECELG